MGYEPAIEIHEIAEEIREAYDKKLMDYTLKVLYKYGIKVDEQRLLSALAFDRTQYYKGYQDGYAQAKGEIVKSIQDMSKFDSYIRCGELDKWIAQWGVNDGDINAKEEENED